MRSTSSLRLLLIGAVAALALAGCGRKGPLDAPPGAWVTQPGQSPHAGSTTTGTGTTPVPVVPPNQQVLEAPTDELRAVAPQGPNRRIPADWLLN